MTQSCIISTVVERVEYLAEHGGALVANHGLGEYDVLGGLGGGGCGGALRGAAA